MFIIIFPNCKFFFLKFFAYRKLEISIFVLSIVAPNRSVLIHVNQYLRFFNQNFLCRPMLRFPFIFHYIIGESRVYFDPLIMWPNISIFLFLSYSNFTFYIYFCENFLNGDHITQIQRLAVG